MKLFIKKFIRKASVILFAVQVAILSSSCVDEQKANEQAGINLYSEGKPSSRFYPSKVQETAEVGPKKNSDEHLKKRAAEYFEAIHDDHFNSKRVISYMYPGIFTYVKNNNKGHYYETDVVKIIKEPVQQLKAMVKKANASYYTDVEEIGKRIKSGDKKIYFLKFSMTIKKGMDSYTLSDQILGISLSENDEWTFLEANETAREILRLEFPFREMDEMMTEIQRIAVK